MSYPHDTNVCREYRHTSEAFLTFVLDWGEWAALRSGWFVTQHKTPTTYWIGGLEDLQESS
jgi:hypothetical protein